MTAGTSKIWIRRGLYPESIHPTPGINVFFCIDGGPDALVAHRARLIDKGIETTSIIDEQRLPNVTTNTPDGYNACFITASTPPPAASPVRENA